MEDTIKTTKSQGFDNLNTESDPYDNILTGTYNEMMLRLVDQDTHEIKNSPALGIFKFKSQVETGGKWDHKPTIRRHAQRFFNKKEIVESKLTPIRHATVLGTYLPGDKQYIYDYDIWSNIHYGYAGRAAEFSNNILDKGARLHDLKNGHKDAFSETNTDANAVQLGIKLYDKYGEKLKKSDMEREIFENRASLSRYERKDLIEKGHVVRQGETVFSIAMKNNIAVEEVMRKNIPRQVFHLKAGEKIALPRPEEIKLLSPAEYKETLKNPVYLMGSGKEHDQLVEKMKLHFEAKENYSALFSEMIEKLTEGAETPSKTNFYIWKTEEDTKVRLEHFSRNGLVFQWGNPPEGGNPGTQYGCRCEAQIFNKDNFEIKCEEYILYKQTENLNSPAIEIGDKVTSSFSIEGIKNLSEPQEEIKTDSFSMSA